MRTISFTLFFLISLFSFFSSCSAHMNRNRNLLISVTSQGSMRVFRSTLVQMPYGLRACSSSFGTDSILGTSTMSSEFLKSLQEDLKNESNIRCKGIGETLTNYINSSELSHMESPEADRAFLKKLDTQLENFFANIPTPEDPMKAALARTDEELEEQAASELVREAVREAYIRKLNAKAAEEVRLKRSMAKLESVPPKKFFSHRDDEVEEERMRAAHVQTSSHEKNCNGDNAYDASDEEALRRKLAAMKEDVARLEALLGTKKE